MSVICYNVMNLDRLRELSGTDRIILDYIISMSNKDNIFYLTDTAREDILWFTRVTNKNLISILAKMVRLGIIHKMGQYKYQVDKEIGYKQ